MNVAAPHPDARATPIPPPAVEPAAFTRGSTLRHVVVMTAAGSAGLVAVFGVDFLTLLYISRLGDTNLTAAVGYASQVVFLLMSVNIGLSIAVGALISRALGAGDRAGARRLAASGLTLAGALSGALGFATLPFTHPILALIGAHGETLEVGAIYLRLVLPATVFLGVGMAFSAVLRAVGDPRRAMYVTLSGAIVAACLDPIFIFVLHLGIYGAGIVAVISRVSCSIVGWRGAVRVHDLVERPRLPAMRADIAPIVYVAGPAILTNLATPIANMYAMRIFSRFGDTVVAAFAIMDRVTPMAFGVLFAMTSAVGPIIGQNYGARLFDRIRGILGDCYGVAVAYVVGVGLLLWVGAPFVVMIFAAKGETATLVAFFCHLSIVMWLFLGGLFVANAAFNNLGWPMLSTAFNWGRATLGTIPFVTIGALWYGPRGGYVGMIGGAALFGVLAVVASYRVVARLAASAMPEPATPNAARAP